jgi:hypothetical protein
MPEESHELISPFVQRKHKHEIPMYVCYITINKQMKRHKEGNE